MLISYTYDDNGNLLSQLDVNSTAIVTHGYDGFNQLVSSVTGEGTITYTYNAQGIRTSRTVGLLTTHYLLDGGNVIGEVEGDETYTYVRGINLIFGRARYYLYNAHGDVVQLTNTNGQLTKNYNYDAFGNERAPKEDDLNPFRYCGEYFDTETGLYYLRARYYDPLIGRFTQEDTHWNTANMIYGDTPQKINEREDTLGLKHYSYAPQILSVLQAGNLYVYCVNNPIPYVDNGGQFIRAIVGAVTGAIGGGITAFFQGKNIGNAMLAGALGGIISGAFLDISLAITAAIPVAGVVVGLAINALGSMAGALVQNVAEQLLNGTDWEQLDWKSAGISAGIGAGFSLLSYGFGMLINDAFQLTPSGEALLKELVRSITEANIPAALVSAFLSVVFIELDKAMVETLINGG